MNVREAILKYPYMVDELKLLDDRLNDTIERKNRLEYSIKSSKITGMPHGTQISNPVLDAVQRVIDDYYIEIQDICKEIENIKIWKKHLDKTMGLLKEREKELVTNLQSYGFDNIRKIRDRMYIGKSGYFEILKRVINKLDIIQKVA